MAQNPCLFSEIAITWFSIWWQSISSEKRQSQASRNSQKQLLRSQSCGALHHICMFDIWARSQNKRCLNWIVRILNSKFKLSTCTVCIQERPRNELMWHCAKIFLVLALIFFTSSLLAHCGQEYLDTALITKPWRQQKNTGRKNYVSIHILHTAELFAKHKTDDLSEAHRNFMASKWWLIKTSLNHLNPYVPPVSHVSNKGLHETQDSDRPFNRQRVLKVKKDTGWNWWKWWNWKLWGYLGFWVSESCHQL